MKRKINQVHFLQSWHCGSIVIMEDRLLTGVECDITTIKDNL